MLGAVFGDIVGSAYEWHNVKTKVFPLQRQETRYTDDSVMTLAVAKWLLEDPSHSESHLIKCMQLLGREHFNAGYGGRFRAWLMTDNPQPYNSWGNGSAMRVSPVALCATSLEEALELARITANVTHNHPEGVKGAMAIAECVYRCLVAPDVDTAKRDIREVIPQKYGYNLSRTLDEIRPNYQFYVSCQDSVPEAIIAFLESDSLEDCARNAISIGGDSDTIAAIACSIYAVKNNLEDETLAKEFEQYLSPDLLRIMEDFEKMVGSMKDRSNAHLLDKKNVKNTLQDRIRGSLIGGAIGDALGYPVEFIYPFEEIQAKYGERGITRLDTMQFWLGSDKQNAKAVVSDDTQMTLFTANGLLNAKQQGIDMKHGICRAYVEWYVTQTGKKLSSFNDCWISSVPELNANRAPGTTCMSALNTIYYGGEPHNNSKGCGGVMRIAPIPLYASVESRMDVTEAARLAGEAAEITHQHPLGYIPAALMAHVIYRLALEEQPTKSNLKQYIVEGMEALEKLYPESPIEVQEMQTLVKQAINCSENQLPDLENIISLGEGWVGDEALAIALYCCLRHFDSFEEALIASVNHGGDSDSTGAVTGNILGVAVGYDAIPQFFKDDLEMHDLILHMADDLYRGEVTLM